MERSRGWQKFKSGMKRAYQRYDRMMEKQGFYVVLAICVLVIGLSAFYTFRLRSEEEEPVLTSGEAESADSSQAQTLSEAKELVTGSEADQLHLSPEGHQKLAQAMKEKIEEILG